MFFPTFNTSPNPTISSNKFIPHFQVGPSEGHPIPAGNLHRHREWVAHQFYAPPHNVSDISCPPPFPPKHRTMVDDPPVRSGTAPISRIQRDLLSRLSKGGARGQCLSNGLSCVPGADDDDGVMLWPDRMVQLFFFGKQPSRKTRHLTVAGSVVTHKCFNVTTCRLQNHNWKSSLHQLWNNTVSHHPILSIREGTAQTLLYPLQN